MRTRKEYAKMVEERFEALVPVGRIDLVRETDGE